MKLSTFLHFSRRIATRAVLAMLFFYLPSIVCAGEYYTYASVYSYTSTSSSRSYTGIQTSYSVQAVNRYDCSVALVQVSVPSDVSITCECSSYSSASTCYLKAKVYDSDPRLSSAPSPVFELGDFRNDSFEIPWYNGSNHPYGKTYWVMVYNVPQYLTSYSGTFSASFNLTFHRTEGGSGGGGDNPSVGGTQTVTFNANGGVCSWSAQGYGYTIGSTYQFLPYATKSGYTFAGWWTASSGGTHIVVDSTVSSSPTLTLYAHWKTAVIAVTSQSDIDGYGFFHARVPAAGGTATVVLKNYGTSSMWINCVDNIEWAPSSSGYGQSTTIAAGSSHTFSWAVKKNTTGNDRSGVVNFYNADQSVMIIGYIDQKGVDTANQSVTFDANGGSCSVSSATYTTGGTYSSPSLPTASQTTRTGYSFAGWWTSSSGGTQITASSTVSSATTRTLYAHWTANTYTVTYHCDGGTKGSNNPGSATYGTSFYVSAPSKSGSTFAGWTITDGLDSSTAKWGTSSSPSTTISSSSTKCVNGASGNVYFKNLRSTSGSVTLTANWTPNAATTYTITYKPGSNSSGSQQTDTKTHDVALTLMGAVFTRTGYTQTGWATSDGGTKAYNLSASYTANAAATLYPFWTANTYTVSLDRQSGAGGTSSVTATYGQSMPSITVPTRSGYTFGGYYTSTAGSGTQSYTASGASARTWDKTTATTLYAKWTETISAPSAPTVSISTYGSNANASSITISWSGGSGATSFNLYRSSSTTRPSSAYKTNVTSPYVDSDSSLTPGVKYYYWVEAKNSAGSAFSNVDWGNRAVALSLGSTTTSATASGGSKSVSVTANTSWSATKNVSWITLNTSSGSSSGTCSFTVDANSSTSSRTGYVIVTAGSGTPYPKTVTNTVAQAANAATTYTITYKPGSNGSGSQQTATKTQDVSLTLKGAIFTRTGYTQTGWSTSDGGAKAYNLSASYTANAAATLYPFWTANTYTVTLDRQSGSGGSSSVTATYGQAMPSITVPTRLGYTFDGYYTSIGGSGTQYYTASGASARTWDKTTATTFYAKWTETISAPSAPTVSISTYGSNASASSITVAWSGGAGSTSFNLYRSTTGSRPSSAYKTNVTSPYVDSDSSLVPGVKYYYWVEAKNSAGSAFSGSDWGNRAVTLSLGSTTTSATTSGGSKSVAVTANTSWSATKDASWITLSTSSGSSSGTCSFTVAANSSTSSRTGHVIVTAGGGTSYPKTVTNTVTQAGASISAPSAPTGVSASDGASTASVTVTWTASSGATSYQVFRATSSSGTKSQIGTATTTSYTDTTATPGTLYYYWVKASNAGGASSFSSNNSGYRKLAAPTILSASGSPTGLALEWGAVTGATHYRVCRSSTVSGSKTQVGAWQTGLTFTDTTGKKGATYCYFVQAACTSSGGRSSDFSAAMSSQWTIEETLQPVYRFFSKNYKGHFYTIDEAEKNSLIATNPNWTYEGIAYYAYTTQASGTVPLYRFYSKAYRGHFFTINEAEMRTVRNTNPNWNYEGVAYYVGSSDAMGACPVYRFWSKEYRHHFYTMNYSEMLTLCNTNPNWNYETVAFYAWPMQIASLVSAQKTDDATENSAGDADVATEEAVEDEFENGIDRFVLTGEGVFSTGLFRLEVQSGLPDAVELAWSRFAATERDAPVLALRIALPPGEALLWSAADGEQESGSVNEGVLDFNLPVDGVWHWLYATDESGNESVSVWLRALTD